MESFSVLRVTAAVLVAAPVLWVGGGVFVVVCVRAEVAMAMEQAKTKNVLLTFIDNILKRKNRLIFNRIWPTFKAIFKTNNILYEASSHCLARIFLLCWFGSCGPCSGS